MFILFLLSVFCLTLGQSASGAGPPVRAPPAGGIEPNLLAVCTTPFGKSAGLWCLVML